MLRIPTSFRLVYALSLVANAMDLHAGSTQKPFTIMIDPAGNEQHAGRIIENTFERGLTVQCAQTLSQELKNRLPGCTILMTRTSGENSTEFHHATVANRMAVDLYISLHFFQAIGVTSSIYLYQFSYNDDQLPLPTILAFYPYDQAHRIHSAQTSAWIGIFKKIFSENAGGKYALKGAFKLPFAPLIGIIAPAIGIEVGLIHAGDWHMLIDPIAESICSFKEQCL